MRRRCLRLRRPMLARFLLLAMRLVPILFVAWLALALPLPLLDRLPFKEPLISLLTVILVGKTVYDTLFYDHFRA